MDSLNYNSVENVPGFEARAAFTVKSSSVFKIIGSAALPCREHVDIVPTIVDDSLSYVPWGGDNLMPFNIVDLVEKDETLATCQVFNAEVCYGSGLRYDATSASAQVKADADDFLLDNDLAEDWVRNTFTSDATFNTICGYTTSNPTRVLTERLVVAEAMRRAIPSLDIVLTPNGFGVVSTQNLAPASKPRVDRLVGSMLSHRDDCITALLPALLPL